MNSKLLPDSEWIKTRIAEEPYWFHRIELPGGTLTPGWSDPRVDKLPPLRIARGHDRDARP